jgi:alpha-glucosidase
VAAGSAQICYFNTMLAFMLGFFFHIFGIHAYDGIWPETGFDAGDITTSFPPLPTITPTIFDPEAPEPQKCPGYRASNVKHYSHGLTANLTLTGEPCNVFGKDILDLSLKVSYQAKGRLNIQIQPHHISPANRSRFILGNEFVRLPEWDGHTSKAQSDFVFRWSNDPSFQFSVSRRHDDEELLSTFGHVIVFEDQFIELVTSMIEDYNVYGLAENIRDFRLGTNYTQTLFNTDAPNVIDKNSYGTHPFYQETRYWEGKLHSCLLPDLRRMVLSECCRR